MGRSADGGVGYLCPVDGVDDGVVAGQLGGEHDPVLQIVVDLVVTGLLDVKYHPLIGRRQI